MSKEDLLRQADSAERHAGQAVDPEVRDALRRAAEDYRREAEQED